METQRYWLVIATDSYAGNFERELIAYVFGILDSVQMGILYGKEYLDQFYQDEKMTYDQCVKELDEYLIETYQDVDDWRQMIFYTIGSYKPTKEHCNAIKIQLKKPLDGKWQNIVLRRVRSFFSKEIYKNTENQTWKRLHGMPGIMKENPKLTHFELVDLDRNLIEEFLF